MVRCVLIIIVTVPVKGSCTIIHGVSNIVHILIIETFNLMIGMFHRPGYLTVLEPFRVFIKIHGVI